MRARSLSRRTFLASLSGGALVLLAACKGVPPRPATADEPGAVPEPTPTPPALRISALAGAAPGTFVQGLSSFLAAQVPAQPVELADTGCRCATSSAPT